MQADGRARKGDKKISARTWNRLVRSVSENFGVAAAEPRTEFERIVVTMRRDPTSDLFLPGHAVEYSYTSFDNQTQQAGDIDPMPGFDSSTPPQTEQAFASAMASNEAIRLMVSANMGVNKSPKAKCRLVAQQGSSATSVGVTPPVGFVTEVSPPGSRTARVCIAGLCLAMVRVFRSQLIAYSGYEVLVVRGLVAPRDFSYSGDILTSATVLAIRGVMDLSRGGHVQLVSTRVAASSSFPSIKLVWVRV